ncbi:MAG: hypothetical protein U0270_20090 [Labilithrix sp.]
MIKIAGSFVAHWRSVEHEVGQLDTWSRTRALERNIASRSVVNMFSANESGNRVVFTDHASTAYDHPQRGSIAVVEFEAGNVGFVPLDELVEVSLGRACLPWFEFAKDTLVVQYCVGGHPTENARLGTLLPTASRLARIDGTGLGSVEQWSHFAVDRDGTTVIANNAFGPLGNARVFTLTSEASPRTIERADQYVISPGGKGVRAVGGGVLWRRSLNPPSASRILAMDVKSILSTSEDGYGLVVNKKAPDREKELADLSIVDTTTMIPAFASLVATSNGRMLGWNGKTAIYLDMTSSPSIKAATPDGASTIIVDSPARPYYPTTSTGPYISGKRLVFASLTKDAAGLYVVELPGS